MKETDIAWAAGFFDGEGGIYITGHSVQVIIGQKELEPLEDFISIVGKGNIKRRELKTPSGKQTYLNICRIKASESQAVLEILLPYLRLKKNLAKQAIETREIYREYKERMQGRSSIITRKSMILKKHFKEFERHALVRELREEGNTFKVIAEKLNVSRQRAQQLYNQMLSLRA